MRESKGLRNSRGALLLANKNHRKKVKYINNSNNKRHRHRCWLWLWPPVETVAMGKAQRRRIPWGMVCGVILFALGLISLFTGHVASNLEWYSHKLVKHRFFWYKKVVNLIYICCSVLQLNIFDYVICLLINVSLRSLLVFCKVLAGVKFEQHCLLG